MTDDLMRFLRDRLNEDEQAARFAGGTWMVLPVTGWIHTAPSQEWQLSGTDHHVASVPLEGDRAHIVRHDPARVLRKVEAKRQIVNEYALTLQLRDEASDRIKAAGDSPAAKDLDTWNRAQREAAVLAGVVRLLALPYADHPDYREE